MPVLVAAERIPKALLLAEIALGEAEMTPSGAEVASAEPTTFPAPDTAALATGTWEITPPMKAVPRLRTSPVVRASTAPNELSGVCRGTELTKDKGSMRLGDEDMTALS